MYTYINNLTGSGGIPINKSSICIIKDRYKYKYVVYKILNKSTYNNIYIVNKEQIMLIKEHIRNYSILFS